MRSVLREPKTGGSDQRLDIADDFDFRSRKSSKKIISMMPFYFEVTLRMNITAYTAAHTELILKPFVISHVFSAFTCKAMKIQ